MNKCNIGLGLAALGRPEYINIRTKDTIDKSEKALKQNTFNVLDFAYQKGVRYYDTAPSYGKGEQFLLEWNSLRQYPNVDLGTKWGYTYVANWQLGFKGQHEVKEHSLDKLKEQWSQSKKMLPALKVYQVHSATFDSGVLENQAVLNQLMQIKKTTGIRIGITTSGSNQKAVLEEALKISIDQQELFDSFQVTYNILEQDTLDILIKAKRKGKFIIIKEALANGRIFRNKSLTHYNELYKKIHQLSNKYRVGFDAIALRFCIDTLMPNIVLSGASNVEQLEENLKAQSFRLTSDEVNMLKKERTNSKNYWEERKQLIWN